MKTILVTGADGFIGKNLCAQLNLEKDINILRFGRDNTNHDLAVYVKKADFIFHLAGVNRSDDERDFEIGNKELTEEIVSLLSKKTSSTPLLITSSIQVDRDNAYGISKKAAETAVLDWANSANDNHAFIFRLPNVFGKWCRPNYNSVVATFCNNICRGLDITVSDPSVILQLAYIDDVVSTFIQAMHGTLEPSNGYFYNIPHTFKVQLGELANKLQSFKQDRNNLTIPDFENIFDRYLYGTYTSYLHSEDFAYPLEMKRDDRGYLAEFIKSKHFGQIFISRTKPGIARGNHWHSTKVEKFLVIEGQAEIKFRIHGSKEILRYPVDDKQLKVVDIPTGYIHSIVNTGDSDLVTIFWADEMFNPDKPDTYYQNV